MFQSIYLFLICLGSFFSDEKKNSVTSLLTNHPLTYYFKTHAINAKTGRNNQVYDWLIT